MKNIRCKCAATVSALLFLASGAAAQNPIIQHTFTADPAPLVHGDTLYLYTGHDEDEAPKSHFIMYDYLCFSTTDMVNWTAQPPLPTPASCRTAATPTPRRRSTATANAISTSRPWV